MFKLNIASLGDRDDLRKQLADKDAELKAKIIAATQKEGECKIHTGKVII